MTQVLITERDPSIAALLETVIRRVPECEITVARDPDSATKALRSQAFGLILLDVGMYSDGLETLHSLRGPNANCEVIALTTGVVGASLIKTLAEADVFAVLMKPFDTDQLEAVVRESLRPERIPDPNRPLVYREFGEKPTHD